MSKSLKEKASERLVEARKARGLEAQEAAIRCGIKPNTYYQYENGTRFPPLPKAIPIARKLKVSLDWWLAGIGSATSADDADIVPILGWVSAGDMLRDDVSQDALGSIRVAELPAGDWIALRVTGDSMDRISPPGSVILVNRKDKNLVPNACYVIDDGAGNATYKRYRPDPVRFEPVSVNPVHEPIFMEGPDNLPTIIGRVCRSIIDMK